jgi:sarcosine oxidase gamma subunit
MTRTRSQTSTVNISDGRAVISVNGRVYRNVLALGTYGLVKHRCSCIAHDR